MKTLSQARELIWQSVIDHEGPEAVSAATKDADGKPAVSVSMLYKFKPSKGDPSGRSRLGRESVTALALVLTEIEPDVWLAAMGVGTDDTTEAVA